MGLFFDIGDLIDIGLQVARSVEARDEMNAAKALGIRNPGELFMNMWIFIHGAACMSITGDYDLSMDETIRLLSETYEKNAPK